MRRLFFLSVLCLATLLQAGNIQKPIYLDGTFRQVKSSDLLDKDIVQTGHVHYEASNAEHGLCIRWEYDDSELGFVSCGSEQSKDRRIRQITEMILNCISGIYLQENYDFNVRIEADEAILTPKKSEYKRLFQEIRITFNPLSGIADRVIILEQNYDQTDITFEHMTYRY